MVCCSHFQPARFLSTVVHLLFVMASVEEVVLARVLNQTRRGTCPRLPIATTALLRNRFVARTGGPPTDRARPSRDQLSALQYQFLEGRAPFVDFAIFGPYGQRTAVGHKPTLASEFPWWNSLVGICFCLQALLRFEAQHFVEGALHTQPMKSGGRVGASSALRPSCLTSPLRPRCTCMPKA